MIVIVRNKKRLEIKRYKIFGFLYVLINKLKGNEVEVMLNQIQYYYGISDQEIMKIKLEKVERQIKREEQCE